MKLIDYIKIFAFLAFAGSVFLSTVFHYPVFTIFWFIAMVLLMISLAAESSALIILAFIAFAYIPLGLISLSNNWLEKTGSKGDLSPFAWFLFILVVIELIFAVSWILADRDY